MLTQEEDVDANALHRRGWTISAIARHLHKDRKTIRAYVTGQRSAGVRVKSPDQIDAFDPFAQYVAARLVEDPHLWARTLFDEVAGLGYDQAYQTFTRKLRERGLRPHCEPCSGAKGRPAAVIEHPAGEETQWDWLELPDPPVGWDYPSGRAFLLVGALAHSGKWRGVLCESMDQAHLVDALAQVTRALGGLTKVWRFDRMATVCHPDSGRVTASFAAVAKHYGVQVAICPPRRGNRKGVVEKANHTAAQRWWRNLPDEIGAAEAQARLDTFCARIADARVRTIGEIRAAVSEHAERERLAPVPATAFPLTMSVTRRVDAQCLVAFRGNRYSVPPELARAQVTVAWRLGAATIDIVTAAGAVLARHRLAPDGAGVLVRDHHHVTALEQHVLGVFDAGRPHRRKERIPPGPRCPGGRRGPA
ncbi:transposase [Streptacidiphilus sp. MAP12-20]|uniref:Mu transposase domain-containing protein n=1 Tax=Streptacidiphilus sp. MAP12-20 TaxID=3156299 RepID=UPI003513E2F8